MIIIIIIIIIIIMISIRTISDIYNFKIMSYCLQIKKEIYVHDRKLL